MREKKNEDDNRERTKGGIVLSVDRMEMEGKSENTAKTSQGDAAEKVGHCYLCFRRLRLLRTFLAPSLRSCAAADVSLSLVPK